MDRIGNPLTPIPGHQPSELRLDRAADHFEAPTLSKPLEQALEAVLSRSEEQALSKLNALDKTELTVPIHNGDSLLHVAVRLNLTQVSESLIERLDSEKLGIVNLNKRTALMLALMARNSQIARKLLDKMSLSDIMKKDVFDQTALEILGRRSRGEFESIKQRLLEKKSAFEALNT